MMPSIAKWLWALLLLLLLVKVFPPIATDVIVACPSVCMSVTLVQGEMWVLEPPVCSDAKLLWLQWNGDITSRHTSTGNTVLHVACAGGHISVVQFLLAVYDDRRSELMHMYNDLPVNLLNFDCLSPLMLAADRGTYRISYVYMTVYRHSCWLLIEVPTGFRMYGWSKSVGCIPFASTLFIPSLPLSNSAGGLGLGSPHRSGWSILVYS